ncbi:MAG: ABC transporter substrate-binding protein [Betaproteobacteria bacterium]|nr:ABC transporter substrate-binding protein [Betaproteobacteria bacterium]
MNIKMSNRRRALKALGLAPVLAAASAFPRLSWGQPLTKVRCGYIHTIAVDGQIWAGEQIGAWKKEGLEMEFIKFDSGLAIFQAMIGGGIDMLSVGAYISNFPASGQGKAFLINSIEYATAQLWVRTDQRINTFADLKGKRISTAIGSTADVFLRHALAANGVNPAKDVEIVNQRMPDAVASFISGAVPAVALWVPFNLAVEKNAPTAKMLVDASAYYPQSAIIGGWVASNEFYQKRQDVIQRVVRAWVAANDHLVGKPDEMLAPIQAKHYPDVPLDSLRAMYRAAKVFPSREWAKFYRDGTVNKWLNQVTNFYVDIGALKQPLPAEKYFDPKPFLAIVEAAGAART